MADDIVDIDKMRGDYLLVDQACTDLQAMIAELRAVVSAIEDGLRAASEDDGQ